MPLVLQKIISPYLHLNRNFTPNLIAYINMINILLIWFLTSLLGILFFLSLIDSFPHFSSIFKNNTLKIIIYWKYLVEISTIYFPLTKYFWEKSNSLCKTQLKWVLQTFFKGFDLGYLYFLEKFLFLTEFLLHNKTYYLQVLLKWNFTLLRHISWLEESDLYFLLEILNIPYEKFLKMKIHSSDILNYWLSLNMFLAREESNCDSPFCFDFTWVMPLNDTLLYITFPVGRTPAPSNHKIISCDRFTERHLRI